MGAALSKSECRALQRLYAAALIARGQNHRAKELTHCVLEDERKEVTGYRTWRCQHCYCLFCSWRYSIRLTRKFIRRIEKLMREGYRLSFLTLTIPNVPSLSPALYKWLALNLKRLLRRDPFAGRVFGAVARIETDFNPYSQDFHPHIHVMLIYKQCIPQEEIVAAWRGEVYLEHLAQHITQS